MTNKTDLKILEIDKKIKSLQEQKSLLGLLKFWHYCQNFKKNKKVESVTLLLKQDLLFIEYNKDNETHSQIAFDAFKRDVVWWCDSVEMIDFKEPVIFNKQYTKRVFLKSVCPKHLSELHNEAK